MKIWNAIRGCTRSRVYDPHVPVGFAQFAPKLSDEGYLKEWNKRVDANLARRAERKEVPMFLREQA